MTRVSSSESKSPLQYLVPYAYGLVNRKIGPETFVSIGFFFELLQMVAFVFNSHMPVSSTDSRLWLAIIGGLQGNFLWDSTLAWSPFEVGYTNAGHDHQAASLGQLPGQGGQVSSTTLTYSQYLVFFWISAVASTIPLIGLVASVARPSMQMGPVWSLHLALSGPLFYPVANILLSGLTCTGGTTGYLWLFPGEGSCMGTTVLALHWVLSLVFFTIFVSVMLIAAYGSLQRDRGSRPSQSNTWMQRATWLYRVGAVLAFHLLLARDMHSYFVFLLGLISFLMAAGYCFIIPYYRRSSNQAAAIAYSVVGWCSWMVFAHLNEGEPQENMTEGGFYGQVVAGSVVCALLAYSGCKLRLCATTQYLLAQSIQPEWVPMHRNPFAIAAATSDPDLLPFPRGLPHSDQLFSPIRHIEQEILSDYHAKAAEAIHHNNDGEDDSQEEEARKMQELLDVYLATVQVVSPLIDRIHCSTDVELSCRFLHEWTITTSSPPTAHMLSFAARIFSKGMLKFCDSPIVVQHYVDFICNFAPSLTRLKSCVAILNETKASFDNDLTDLVVFVDQIRDLHSDLGIVNRNQQSTQRAMSAHYRSALAQNAILWRGVNQNYPVTTLAAQVSMYNDIRRASRGAFMQSMRQDTLDEIQIRRFAHFMRNIFDSEEGHAVCMKTASIIRNERRARLVTGDVEDDDDDNDNAGGGDAASAKQKSQSAVSSARMSRSAIRAQQVDRQKDLYATLNSILEEQSNQAKPTNLYYWMLVLTFTVILGIIGANFAVTFVVSDHHIQIDEQLVPMSNARTLVPLLSVQVRRLVNTTKYIATTKEEISSGVAASVATLTSLEEEAAYLASKLSVMREELVSTLNTVTVGPGKPASKAARLFIEERVFRVRIYYSAVNGIDHEDRQMNFVELTNLFTTSLREIDTIAASHIESLIGSHYVDTVTFNAPRVLSEALRAAMENNLEVDDERSVSLVGITMGILVMSLIVLLLMSLGMLYQANSFSARRLQSIQLLFDVPSDIIKRLAEESFGKLEAFMESESTLGMDAPDAARGSSAAMNSSPSSGGGASSSSGGKSDAHGGGPASSGNLTRRESMTSFSGPTSTQITSHHLLTNILKKDTTIKAGGGGPGPGSPVGASVGSGGPLLQEPPIDQPKTIEGSKKKSVSKSKSAAGSKQQDLEDTMDTDTVINFLNNGHTQSDQEGAGALAAGKGPRPSTANKKKKKKQPEAFSLSPEANANLLGDGSDSTTLIDDEEAKMKVESEIDGSATGDADKLDGEVAAVPPSAHRGASGLALTLLMVAGLATSIVLVMLGLRTITAFDDPSDDISKLREMVQLEQQLGLDAKAFACTEKLQYYTGAMKTIQETLQVDSTLERIHSSAVEPLIAASNHRIELHYRTLIALSLVAHALHLGPQEAPEAQDPYWVDSESELEGVVVKIHNSTWQLAQSEHDQIEAARYILMNAAYDHLQEEFLTELDTTMGDRLLYSKEENERILAERETYSALIAVLACLASISFLTLIARFPQYRTSMYIGICSTHFVCLATICVLTLLTSATEASVVSDAILRDQVQRFLVEDMLFTTKKDSKVRGYVFFSDPSLVLEYEAMITDRAAHEREVTFFTLETPPSITSAVSDALNRSKILGEEVHYLQRIGLALASQASGHHSDLPLLHMDWSLHKEPNFILTYLTYPSAVLGQLDLADGRRLAYYNVSTEDLADTNTTILREKALGAVGSRRYADILKERLLALQEVAEVVDAEVRVSFTSENTALNAVQLVLSGVAVASIVLLYTLLCVSAIVRMQTDDQGVVLKQLFPLRTTNSIAVSFLLVAALLVGLTGLNLQAVQSVNQETKVLSASAARSGDLARSVGLLEDMVHSEHFSERLELRRILQETLQGAEEANADVLFGNEAFGRLRKSQNIAFFGPQAETPTADIRTLTLGDESVEATFEGPTGSQQTGILQFLSLVREVDSIANYHSAALADQKFGVIPQRYIARVTLAEASKHSLSKMDTVFATLRTSTASYAEAVIDSGNDKRIFGGCLAGVTLIVVIFVFGVLVFPVVDHLREQESESRLIFLSLPEDALTGDIADFITGEEESDEKQMAKNQLQSERLLQNILPPAISRRLKGGETTIADQHENVTVAFAALSGFDEYSTHMAADELVLFLNNLIVVYDAIVDLLELEKIKTIADTYFLCGGLSKQSEKDHPLRTVDCAMFFMEALREHNVRHQTPNLKMRIGVHTGPAVAGVIGTTKVAYDLWGDTVNTASRMYSTSKPGKIQLSSNTHDTGVKNYFSFTGNEVVAKGKGTLNTFLLDERTQDTPWSVAGWRRKVNA